MTDLIRKSDALAELIAAYEDIMDYGIVFAKKDQQDRLNAAKEKFAAIRAIAALPAVTVGADAVLDAVHEYLTQQYGASPIGHPIDRARILALIAKGAAE